MTTTLDRLVSYPHAAVFDATPDARLVMRIQHQDGATWTITDEVLTASAGVSTFRYDLATLTVAGLAAALTSDGFQASSVSPDFADLGATVLIEGAGTYANEGGDQLQGFTSLMWALFSGYAPEVRELSYAVGQAIRQMVIPQSEGEWLDLWGTLYGVPRNSAELDGTYAPRIPQEAFRIRVNAFAIEDAVFDATGYRITIVEPWKSLFRLSDNGVLSGDAHLYDGANWGYHLIQPVAAGHVDWAAILPIIERNKAGGVIVIGPREDIAAELVSFNHRAGCASFGRLDTQYVSAPRNDGGELDDSFALSDYHIKLNYQSSSFQLMTVKNDVGLDDAQEMGPAYVQAEASWRLSDVGALGDTNTMFPGYFTSTTFQGDEHLSGTETETGYALSDIGSTTTTTPIDVVYQDERFILVDGSRDRLVWSSMDTRVKHDTDVQRVRSYGWTGNWDSRLWTNQKPFSGIIQYVPPPPSNGSGAVNGFTINSAALNAGPVVTHTVLPKHTTPSFSLNTQPLNTVKVN